MLQASKAQEEDTDFATYNPAIQGFLAGLWAEFEDNRHELAIELSNDSDPRWIAQARRLAHEAFASKVSLQQSKGDSLASIIFPSY